MLTLEETRLSLSLFNIFSILNILPIHVEVKSGRIQRQLNPIRFFIWKILFGVGVFYGVFMFTRLIQSTVMEPEKYFRWDHFILHFGVFFTYATFYYTGFRLFLRNPEENFIIFNELFVEREDPVQKMIEQLQIKAKPKSGRQNENQVRVISVSGNEKRGKSGTGTQIVSSSAGEPLEETEDEVTENQQEPKPESEVSPLLRPLLAWPPQYSLDELVAKLVPSVVVPSAFCLVLILAVDPRRPQLLFSVLPPEGQNLWSFLILLVGEAYFMVFAIFTSAFAIATQVLFFSKIQLEFKRKSLQLRHLEEKFQSHSLENRGPSDIRREVWILRQILKEMRELVLLIELFNRCFPFCIFAWKICGLSCCILFYFFVIRHFQDFPFLGLFLGYGAILMTFLYTIMYAHAFSIPGKMEDLKNEFLLTAQKTTEASNVSGNGNKHLLAEMKREIKKIPCVGIKVGSFHQMERESTPNFVDFVLRNVVSLLVTFPR